MRAPLDIVGREFTKNRPQVLLVEHDNVVQALSVSRLRVPRLRSHEVTKTAWQLRRCRCVGALTEIVAIDSIAIWEQMPRLVAQGVSSIS